MEDQDHYLILGLPSGTEGAKLSIAEIRKAYRSKALSSHPDKRPDDPHAASNFQKIQTSYEILIDDAARKAFDDLLKLKQDRLRRENQFDSKRRKMMSDLEARERAAASDFPQDRDREEEEKASEKLREEIARIRAMIAKRRAGFSQKFTEKPKVAGEGLDKERILKVSWELRGEDYSAQRLKEMFGTFGGVEDVVIQSKGSKRGSGLVVMASKADAVAATKNMFGDLSNPLLVRLLCPAASNLSDDSSRNAEPSYHPGLTNLVGAGYQAYEDSILKKLQKAADKQK